MDADNFVGICSDADLSAKIRHLHIVCRAGTCHKDLQSLPKLLINLRTIDTYNVATSKKWHAQLVRGNPNLENYLWYEHGELLCLGRSAALVDALICSPCLISLTIHALPQVMLQLLYGCKLLKYLSAVVMYAQNEQNALIVSTIPCPELLTLNISAPKEFTWALVNGSPRITHLDVGPLDNVLLDALAETHPPVQSLTAVWEVTDNSVVQRSAHLLEGLRTVSLRSANNDTSSTVPALEEALCTMVQMLSLVLDFYDVSGDGLSGSLLTAIGHGTTQLRSLKVMGPFRDVDSVLVGLAQRNRDLETVDLTSHEELTDATLVQSVQFLAQTAVPVLEW
jgi:hypothetical protein